MVAGGSHRAKNGNLKKFSYKKAEEQVNERKFEWIKNASI